MALFRRQNSSQTPSNVSQIEFNQSSGRRWPMLFIALAIALLIALVLFYGGRWAYRSVFGSGEEPAPISVETTGERTPNPQEEATPQPAPSPTPRSSPSPSTLPNNGPGDILAVFVGTSLAAAGLHYIVSLRRAQRQLS